MRADRRRLVAAVLRKPPVEAGEGESLLPLVEVLQVLPVQETPMQESVKLSWWLLFKSWANKLWTKAKRANVKA